MFAGHLSVILVAGAAYGPVAHDVSIDCCSDAGLWEAVDHRTSSHGAPVSRRQPHLAAEGSLDVDQPSSNRSQPTDNGYVRTGCCFDFNLVKSSGHNITHVNSKPK